jgi:arsenite-transporting ATPase
MRTFTYLNLYGYLTDAVVVNKVFPDEVGEYFSRWRAVQEEHLALVRSAFSPVPVLCAPYFDQEVLGGAMLDRLAGSLFGDGGDAGAVLHSAITQEIVADGDGATLRLALPLARKEDLALKQIGLELIVSAPGQRRTIMLPASLAGYRCTGAKFESGALEVSFQRG